MLEAEQMSPTNEREFRCRGGGVETHPGGSFSGDPWWGGKEEGVGEGCSLA